MEKNLYFDHAATTPCSNEAAQQLQQFSTVDFGNPSSIHSYGQKSARAIREARRFFADTFRVEPEQVIFTGSGTEANNLAITGLTLSTLSRPRESKPSPSVLFSAVEHPSVRKTAEALKIWGVNVRTLPVDRKGQVQFDDAEFELPSPLCVSIQQVNHLVGAIQPVESLALRMKEKWPETVFHVDAVQAFGKIRVPQFPTPIDLLSISAHKVHGPKGVGALILLNKKLLLSRIRPLIWGGEQESGFRSGTQNAGLISGFHLAAEKTLLNMETTHQQVRRLKASFYELLINRGLMSSDPTTSRIQWNSPFENLPHIVSITVQGIPGAALAKLLDDRGCIVSVGSACSSRKPELDPILGAMGFTPDQQASTLRISFSASHTNEDIATLTSALEESILQVSRLTGRLGGQLNPWRGSLGAAK